MGPGVQFDKRTPYDGDFGGFLHQLIAYGFDSVDSLFGPTSIVLDVICVR